VLDPDEEVRHAIWLIFDLFEQSGSALAVVQHFADHHLRCPTRLWGGARHGQLVWGPLSEGRVLAILHNPEYSLRDPVFPIMTPVELRSSAGLWPPPAAGW
jgi:hypothetical protein